jgi:F-box/TPR repeat protein Pof3
MRKMPNLEQLCLVRAMPSALFMETYPHFPWAKLKAVVALEMEFHEDVMQVGLSRLISVCGGDSLRHLEVTSSSTHVEVDDESWLDFYNHGPDTMQLDDVYKRIEAFRTRNIVQFSAGCRKRVRHSLEEGRLHSIDIVFNQPPLNESPEGITSKARLESFDWLRGSTAIRSLGLFNFRFTRLPRNAQDLPLLDFVASFPNLEVLDLNSEHYDSAEFSSVVVDIIKITKLKKIYQATVKGIQLDKLKAVAKSTNVELVWGERPVLWPVPLENS